MSVIQPYAATSDDESGDDEQRSSVRWAAEVPEPDKARNARAPRQATFGRAAGERARAELSDPGTSRLGADISAEYQRRKASDDLRGAMPMLSLPQSSAFRSGAHASTLARTRDFVPNRFDSGSVSTILRGAALSRANDTVIRRQASGKPPKGSALLTRYPFLEGRKISAWNRGLLVRRPFVRPIAEAILDQGSTSVRSGPRSRSYSAPLLIPALKGSGQRTRGAVRLAIHAGVSEDAGEFPAGDLPAEGRLQPSAGPGQPGSQRVLVTRGTVIHQGTAPVGDPKMASSSAVMIDQFACFSVNCDNEVRPFVKRLIKKFKNKKRYALLKQIDHETIKEKITTDEAWVAAATWLKSLPFSSEGALFPREILDLCPDKGLNRAECVTLNFATITCGNLALQDALVAVLTECNLPVCVDLGSLVLQGVRINFPDPMYARPTRPGERSSVVLLCHTGDVLGIHTSSGKMHPVMQTGHRESSERVFALANAAATSPTPSGTMHVNGATTVFDGAFGYGHMQICFPSCPGASWYVMRSPLKTYNSPIGPVDAALY